ncbi:hypothetical protein QC763_0027120 [Podospora pseudopauciseta]|uniref:Uncharacterized protein n=1 Tax=Podospora pseudopauciseta TaxID=2093780 RepID=A0ABR0I3M4_9PEZI|nr:hypothetical protein QC763_0027120 [Podospora pseudopauciseta]
MPPVPPLILRGQYKNLAPRSPIVAGLINKLNRGFPALYARQADNTDSQKTNDTSEAFGKTYLRSAFWVLGVRAELEKHAPDLSSNHNRPSRSSSSHPPPFDPSPWKLTSVRQTAAGRYTPGSSSASIRQGEI